MEVPYQVCTGAYHEGTADRPLTISYRSAGLPEHRNADGAV